MKRSSKDYNSSFIILFLDLAFPLLTKLPCIKYSYLKKRDGNKRN